jgi:hypothetical protein
MTDTTTAAQRVTEYLNAWNRHPHPTTRDLEIATFTDGETMYALTQPDLHEILDKLGSHSRTIHQLGEALGKRLATEQYPLIGPWLSCFGCVVERHQNTRETANPATTIVNGQATCLQHLQLVDGPIIPGRTASGLILGNGG